MLSIEEFCSLYSSPSTVKNYTIALNYFFRTIEKSEITPDDNHRANIIKFRDRLLSDKCAPKTRLAYIAPIFRYYEDNDLPFPTNFKRQIYGKEDEALSSQFCPTPQDIKKLIEFMPLKHRALTLLLCSSGLRLGEALALTLSDIDLSSRARRPVELRRSSSRRIGAYLW